MIALISKGWTYVRSVLTKEDLSSVTLLMGTIYLSYSASFVTSTIPRFVLIVDTWMNLIHTGLLIYVIKNWHTTYEMIKWQYEHYDFDLFPEQRQQLTNCIKIKLQITRWFGILSFIFYIDQLVINGFWPFFSFRYGDNGGINSINRNVSDTQIESLNL